MSDTPRSEGTTEQPWFQDISTRLQRIAELAGADPQMAFTALGHFLDDGLLREAFARTRKDGATGIDDQTAAEFSADLTTILFNPGLNLTCDLVSGKCWVLLALVSGKLNCMRFQFSPRFMFFSYSLSRLH